MPTVTTIVPQKRRQDRFSIYIDGAYRLSLSQDQLTDAAVRVGDNLTEARVTELMQQSEVGKMLDRAYNYLSYRVRSRQEMVRYLRRKGCDDEMAAFLLQRLEDQDHINDQRFARDWVELRQNISPRSRVQLQAELREKGIASDIIAEVLESVDAATEVELLIALVDQKRLRQRYPDNQKLTRYLASKGFGFDAIRVALEQRT
jgi:regulatory protein